MHNERIGPRAGIEHMVIAALIVGFALALGFAFNELDAADAPEQSDGSVEVRARTSVGDVLIRRAPAEASTAAV